MVDASGSMGANDIDGDGFYDGPNEWNNMSKRWEPVRDALITFLEAPSRPGLAASLEYFPQGGQPDGPGTGVCGTAEYSRPAVTARSLEDAVGVAALVDRLNRIVPNGGTPTLPALQGAIEYARATLVEDPSSTAAVVLLTDGQPGLTRVEDGNYFNEKCFCYGEPDCPLEDEVPYAVQAATAAREGDPSVSTYVIGMGEVDVGAVDDIALAGADRVAYFLSLDDPASTRATLVEALTDIAGDQPSCAFALPAPPPGEQFAPSKVNLHYTDESGTDTCLAYGPPSQCERSPWTWYYDNESNPSLIVACEGACIERQQGGGDFSIEQGCLTQIADW